MFVPSIITLQSFISTFGKKYRSQLLRYSLFPDEETKSLFTP